MRKPSKQPAAFSTQRDDDGPTDASNYAQRFIDFARSHGGMHVIRRHPGVGFPATHARWKAWIDWMQAHGVPTNFAISHGVATVPAEWPEDFDSNCEPSDRGFRFEAPPIVSDARRRELAHELRRAVEDVERRNYDPRRRDNAPMRAESPQAALERKMAEYAQEPIQGLSAAARASAKLPPVERDWERDDVSF